MRRTVAALLLATATSGIAEQFPITPVTAYRLTFEAKGEPAGSRWAVHMRDAAGNLPFDGVLEGEWQKLTSSRKSYTHLFYTPPDAVALEVVARDPNVSFHNIKLEKVEAENLLLNGDFSEGEGNYSGWSETYNTQLVEKEGEIVLQVDQNGYALTDYTPVSEGVGYALQNASGPSGLRVLAYDSSRRFISLAERKAGARFKMPAGVGYARLLYATGHEHHPAWRTNKISEAKLLAVEAAEAPHVSQSADRQKIKACREWEIVLTPGCEPREEYAARELQYWIAAITKRRPALLAEPSRNEARKIFLGRAWAEAFPKDLEALAGSDGYAVRTQDENIYVFGVKPRGTLYGVYALLERNSDIVWPRPNSEFEAVYSHMPSLSFANADFLSRPVFGDRYVTNGYDSRNPQVFQEWQARNGLNTPWPLHKGMNYLVWQRGAQVGYTKSYMSLLGDLRNKDEKVLPLVDGKRDRSRWRQPCYTYQGTVDGIVEEFKKLLQTLPGRELECMRAIISDNWTVCGCPDCMAPIVLPNGEKLTAEVNDSGRYSQFFSTRNFLMLNRVAEALVKDYPDLQIRTHAYIFAAEPPKVPVHPAIIPEFAAYPTHNIRYSILSAKGNSTAGDAEQNVWKRRFEQWGKEKKGALGFFGYYNTSGFNAVADTAAEDWRALASFGGKQAHTEGYTKDGEELSSWDVDGMEKWVMAKLMWDPSQDPEALRKDYIRRVYHGAEKEMAEFYKLIRDAWHSAPESTFANCHTAAGRLFADIVVASGIEKRATQMLEDAERATRDPLSRRIIQRHRAAFEKLEATTGRITVPYVEEATTDWQDASSPHWEKAFVVEGFQKVDDWRNLEKAAPAHATRVRIMHDRRFLYLRFDGDDDNAGEQVKPQISAGPAFPNGDRFEARLGNIGNSAHYLAIGPGGHSFSQPSLDGRWKTTVTVGEKSWTALMAIPLNALESDKVGTSEIKARLGRVYRGRSQESEETALGGSSIFNNEKTLWQTFHLQ